MFKNLNTPVLGLVGHESDVIEQALTYHFHAMDLDVVDFAGRAKLRGMAYARRLIDSSKMRMSTFRLPFDLETDAGVFKQNLALLAEWAAAAAEVGCSRCLTAIQPAGDRLPYHENFSVHRDRFAEICDVLRPRGIRLGVGFRAAAELRRERAFQFIHDPDALGMLIKMTGATNIGLDLDAWDWFAAGCSLDALRGIPADQIVSVELADAPADVPLEELTEQARLLPAVDGRFDLPAVLVALAEMGYDGPVSVKPHRSTLRSSRTDPMTKAMALSLDQVWKAAGLTPQGKLGTPAQVAEA